MRIYPRAIQPVIENNLFQGKIIIIYGARQVGKTTLCKAILQKHEQTSLYLNCDEPDIRAMLTNRTSTELRQIIRQKQLIIIDEAQRVKNIGLTLKLIVDNMPHIQVIATGSSSFDLSNDIKEPLTGRKIEFFLHPLSVAELLSVESEPFAEKRLLPWRLRYGTYPEVVNSSDPQAAILEIASSYLYRDVTEYQHLKYPERLHRLMQALALQIGGEVSYNELSNLLNMDKATVTRYVSIMERAYVIFHLPPFSRNLRKELGKRRKIYFYDLGVRNALINNFAPLDLRQDVGGLWENYFVSERVKFNQNRRRHVNTYFWRTYDQQEIDYLEEDGGRLFAFECKWRKKKWKLPAIFQATYPNHEGHLVHSENYQSFLTPPEKGG
jgi:predicted AAA+ superfamily ATPase